MSKSISKTSSVTNWARINAFIELTKPRISVMVLFTFCVAGILSAGSDVNVATLIWSAVGLFFIAASGNAMNMYLERYTDFLMVRTAKRPLPDRRLTAMEVVTFAAICFGISLGVFLAAVNWQTAVCGLATWILYVWIYTPLKTRTWLNTEVGAVPGAMPILMGCLATTGTIDFLGWSFFSVLLLWQFPHFMAIAWIYREQYKQGGHQMLTVVDPSGKRAGRKAILTCILMIAASLLPAMTFRSSIHVWIFLPIALLLGGYYLQASIRFAMDRNNLTARKLLKTSILYLPLFMLLLIISSLC